MIDLHTEDLRLFARCISEGSITAAARVCGLTQAAASRRLQRLEQSLGAPVLHRNTRALRPTAEGERVLAVAREVLAAVDSLERSLAGERDHPSGTVRLSAPTLLGQGIGADLAAALRHRAPALRLDLSLTNERVDLVRTGTDVALRVGDLPDAALLARRLGYARIGAYARADLPSGLPARVEDLGALPWIGLPDSDLLHGHGPSGRRWTGRVPLRFTCSDSVVLRDAAALGLGATLLPAFVGDAHPALVPLLPEWHFGEVPLHAVWLPEARDDARIRAVVEVCATWIADRPEWRTRPSASG